MCVTWYLWGQPLYVRARREGEINFYNEKAICLVSMAHNSSYSQVDPHAERTPRTSVHIEKFPQLVHYRNAPKTPLERVQQPPTRCIYIDIYIALWLINRHQTTQNTICMPPRAAQFLSKNLLSLVDDLGLEASKNQHEKLSDKSCWNSSEIFYSLIFLSVGNEKFWGFDYLFCILLWKNFIPAEQLQIN